MSAWLLHEQEIEVPLSEPALWLLGVRLHVSDDGVVVAAGSEAACV